MSHALKRTLEDRFGHVRVRGEISGFRGPHSSGHCYFCLKDEGAKLDAVIWRGSFARLRSKLQEGLEVIATGKITSYPGKSSYQIIVETDRAGRRRRADGAARGAQRKLAAEGLFDAARKKPIPFLPRVIGVVTSPTGAVIRDILHRLDDRFPRHVLVWPVRVQGETCAAEVAAAIRGFNAMAGDAAPDLIIVARGGGSLEDLWGFNEEIVVRAAAASVIPLISAVGHETDTTLIDFAADHARADADGRRRTRRAGARRSPGATRLACRRAIMRAMARAHGGAAHAASAPRRAPCRGPTTSWRWRASASIQLAAGCSRRCAPTPCASLAISNGCNGRALRRSRCGAVCRRQRAASPTRRSAACARCAALLEQRRRRLPRTASF